MRLLLGGKDNFAADREQAQKLLSVFPRAAELARESRQFQRRAVTYVAGRGIRQFIDLGCGLPTAPNTHETARDIQPDATIAYVDNDELVLSHVRTSWPRLRASCPSRKTSATPDEILYDWRIRRALTSASRRAW